MSLLHEGNTSGNELSSGITDVSVDKNTMQEETYLQRFSKSFKRFWEVATNHRVNRKMYFILVILFGAMGVHRFYARHYLSGILYLSFFFIGFLFYFVHRIGMIIIIPLELLALIQGIWVLLKKDGPDGMVEA